MLLKDVGIDGRHHDVVLAVDDERALLDLLQIAIAIVRGDRTPFSKSDELCLADLGLRLWFAVQLSLGDPLEPSLARRVTRRAQVIRVIDFTPQLCSKKFILEENYETTYETSIRHASVQLSFLRELLLPQRSG